MKIDLRVYVITHRDLRSRSHEEIVRAAIDGGATAVQLRDKEATSRELYEIAARLRRLCERPGIPLIVNDRPDVAVAAQAGGVHVGPDDLPVAALRLIVGPSGVIGASAGTATEAVEAERAGADYLGVGPVFATGTKPDAGAPIGPEGLRRIASKVRIPVVGIGGITPENAHWVIEAGAAGVAVISAVAGADDMVGTVRAIRRAVDAALARRAEERVRR